MIEIKLLENLAQHAGFLIVNGFNDFSKIQSEWKEDDTPCTTTDKAVNTMVLEFFKRHFPSISVIAEEGSDEKESDWVAYCDPIDGTIPYATGLPVSTFCLSIVHKGIPVSAVIADPFRGRIYTAEKGKGAFINRQRIQVSDQREINGQTHASVIWWKNAPYDFANTCKNLQDKGTKWMNFGTIGIVGGLIASGQFELSLFPGNNIWETAAMSLITEEAGGLCTDLFGNKIDFSKNGSMKGHLISNGFLHEKTLDLIQI